MHNLTYLALCAFVCFASAKINIEVPAATVDKVRPIEDQCIKESGSIPDSLHHMLNAALPKDEASSKFMLCFTTKAGYLDENHHFVVDKFLNLAKDVTEGKDDFVKTLNECNQNTSEDVNELAQRMSACFHEKSPYALFIPMRQSR